MVSTVLSPLVRFACGAPVLLGLLLAAWCVDGVVLLLPISADPLLMGVPATFLMALAARVQGSYYKKHL